MQADTSKFKQFCNTAGDLFAVFLTAVMILFPALLLTVGILFVLLMLGLQEEGHASPWLIGAVFITAYLVMVAVWLFKKYGGQPKFIEFCAKHQRFSAATMWTVDKAEKTWKTAGGLVEIVIAIIAGIFIWIGKSIAFILVVVIIGGIFYAMAGALSAPWWAIVIIYLLLNKEK